MDIYSGCAAAWTGQSAPGGEFQKRGVDGHVCRVVTNRVDWDAQTDHYPIFATLAN